jgi:hypothetical protein
VPKDVNSCYCEPPNCCIILPSQTENPTVSQKLNKYVSNIIDGTVVADTVALKMDLSQFDLYVYGSIKSNLWLKKHADELPVKVYKDRIETDTLIKGTDLITTIAWNNPNNKSKDATLYVAQHTASLIGVHGTFQGWKQIHISRNKKLIHSQSYYYEGHKVKYTKSPLIPNKEAIQILALSKEQMHADFSTLEDIILNVLPVKTINESVYGIDISKKLEEFKAEIDIIDTFDGFVDLINRTINFCRGSHFWITNVFKYKGYYKNYKYQHPLYTIPLFYYKGDYYTKYQFEYNNQTYKPGLKVVSVNSETPDQILNNCADQVRLLNWDYTLEKNYKRDFYNLLEADSLNFVFQDQNQTIQTTFFKKTKLNYLPKQWKVKKEVRYFPKKKLLYIGLPEMNDGFLAFYKNELQKLNITPFEVTSIAIDIRNNHGGGDPAWEGLLSYLIDEPIEAKPKLAVKNTSKTMELLSEHESWIRNKIETKETISFSYNENFALLGVTTKIKPHPKSLNLNVPIYIISENVYSSGGSFMNLANYSNRIYSVGSDNSLILGFGSSPFYLMLPNSTIEFVLVPTVDLSHSQQAKDAHHINVELPLELSLEEWINYYNTFEQGNESQFLLEKDPFMKRILKEKNKL